AYTRRIPLGPVFQGDLDYLKSQLTLSAEVASVGVYFHEWQNPGWGNPPVNVWVDVWSENRGSVDDYCDYLLRRINCQGTGHSNVFASAFDYRQRVRNWCDGVNHFFAARGWRMHPL